MRWSHTQKERNALRPKTTDMTTWTLKSRWLVLLNWSFQDGFLEPCTDITAFEDEGDGLRGSTVCSFK